MASYFSNLLTTTTSRVASIRQNLLPTETDGDTEDDTHLCRVLRAYYTEKSRPFPGWLPPDPKAPPPPVVQPIYTNNIGSRYGGLNAQGGAQPGGNSLSSLWDSQPQGHVQGQGDGGMRQQGRGNRLAPAGRQNPFARQAAAVEPQVQARPLPSQRAGSYQTAGAFAGQTQTPPGSSSGLSAKDRLRKNFRGGERAASPAIGGQSGRMVEPVQRSNSYGSTAGGGGGGGNYEDRFMPGGAQGGGGGGDKPFMAATSPWASSEQEFGGGGYGGGSGGARQGLPSGPGAGRRGPGLPSGPRGLR